MNMGVHISVLVFSFSLDNYPGVKPLDDMVVLFLISLGHSILFSQWPHHFTFPLTVHKGPFFSTSLPALGIFCLFGNSLSSRCEVISHCSFDFHFPKDLVMLSISSFTCQSSACLLWKHVYSDLLPIFQQIVQFFFPF